MNSFASSHSPPAYAANQEIVASAFAILDQTPPPSLREILGAYRSKGDGDRDMLLAMLSAKSAEDQRLASVAALHRTLLETVHASPVSHSQLPSRLNGSQHYPTPNFTQSPPLHEQRPLRRSHHHRATSGSRSPRRTYSHLPSMRDAPAHTEHPRKRHRSSRSPPLSHPGPYESHSTSQHEHLPPSPYSSSERSNSAEYSPRSRASMAIGSLLSSGPSNEINTDES